MSEVKIVGRGVDTLVLNVCYADKQFQPIKQELNADLQEILSILQDEARLNESAVVTNWAFKGFNLFMQPKGSRGQWRWILTCPLVTLAISRGRLNQMIAQVRLSSEYLWSCESVSDAIVEVSLLLYDFSGNTYGYRSPKLICVPIASGGMSLQLTGKRALSRVQSVKTGDLLMWLPMGLTWHGCAGSRLLLWILVSISRPFPAASITRPQRSGRSRPQKYGSMISGSATGGTVKQMCGALSSD